MPQDLHLTPADLDALLAGTARPATLAHLFDCAPCRALAAQDRRVVVELARLPRLDPSPHFADRVLTAWKASATAPEQRFIVPLRPHRPILRLARAAVAALVVLTGLGGSVAWSLANSELLLSWRERALGWLASLPAAVEPVLARTGAALFDSPAEAVGWALGFLLAYAAGLVAFRRLTALPPSTIPARRVLHAG
jgi:hypothetical protein